MISFLFLKDHWLLYGTDLQGPGQKVSRKQAIARDYCDTVQGEKVEVAYILEIVLMELWMGLV